MPRKAKLSGPAGNGWVTEKRGADGLRYIAYWQNYEPDSSAPLGRRKAYGGSYLRCHHGPGASGHPAELKEKTFRWFAENIFVPARKTRWRETTAYTVQYFLDKIYRVFGDTRLTDMTDVSMQTFLI